MLTSFADDTTLMDSIVAGASGYILKATKQEDLLAPCGESRPASR
jgi:DNA-binding NarL/FixJ family response regulator